MESQDLHCKSSTSRCQYDPERSAKCSTVRNGTTQCFGTAAQEGTASAFSDAVPSCFFAHSLFSFCVTSSTASLLSRSSDRSASTQSFFPYRLDVANLRPNSFTDRAATRSLSKHFFTTLTKTDFPECLRPWSKMIAFPC